MAEEEVCVVKPHRACWKVNCKWGNKQPSMLPIFYSDDLVFVWTGGKNARFKEMHEGDLLLIAKGKTIDAVAEVAAPPAPLGQFVWHNRATSVLFETYFQEIGEDPAAIRANPSVWGARIRHVFQAPQGEEAWHYDHVPAFGQVHEADLVERAERFWAESRENEKRAQRGLFDWATKELSQDAFFCWLLSALTRANTATTEHKVAAVLLSALTGDEAFGQGVVTIHRQWMNIDILVCVNEEAEPAERRFLIIEDKVGAALYNDLGKYRQAVCEWYKVSPSQVKCAVIKTEDDGTLPSLLAQIKDEAERPRVMLREELLGILQSGGKPSETLADYIDHLTAVNEGFHAWETRPYSEWRDHKTLGWNAWRGFYTALLATNQDPAIGGCGFAWWMYVNNPSAPFNALLIEGENEIQVGKGLFNLFPQLNSTQHEVQIKIGEVPGEQRHVVRAALLKAIATLREAGKLPEALKCFNRPKRLGSGWYMTLQVLPDDPKGGKGWIVLGQDGKVDLPATAKRLKAIANAVAELAGQIQPLLHA